MLTIAKPKQRSKSWPALPYKGLTYYEPDDAPLFAGRENDVLECADLLSCPDTRLLFLHGLTGCGKSSFLRAGLIPFLEHDDLGFGFLKNDVDGKLSSIFIRATGKPLVELAKKVCDFLNSDIKFKKAGKDGFYSPKLPEIMGDYTSEAEFVEKLSSDPELFIKILRDIAVRLPKTLILIIDQGEEVFTLKPHPEDDQHLKRFFRFIEYFSETRYDLKLLIALRTEYLGRFLGKMPRLQIGSLIAQYFLEDLTKEQIVSAIERPTSSENIEDFGVPFEHYRFRYEKGLPEKIASDLISKKLAGGILPVMQIVCDTLYQVVASTTNGTDGTRQREISEANYCALGSIEDQIDKSLDATFAQWCRKNDITSDREIERETERWKDILSNLAGFQSDGTVTTVVVTADQLREWARESNSDLDFDKTISHLVSPDVRILREVEFFDARSARVLRYSLGHDAFGLALDRWKVGRTEVASAISNVRTRLRWLAVSLAVVAVLSWLIFRPRSLGISVLIVLLPAAYGFFFLILSYPGLDRTFYLLILMYPQLVPRNKLEKLMRDKKFLEMAKRNPAAYERLQRLVTYRNQPKEKPVENGSRVTKTTRSLIENVKETLVMMDLTVAYQEPTGYKYVETSPDLKEAAAALPCFAALHWPDYATKVFDDTINGKPVVIQLWKGWCQQFLSSPNFPGGIGGEVGIYERVTGKGFPADRPDWCPVGLWAFLQQKSKLANGDFFWPVNQKDFPEIEWDFINPVTNEVAFHADLQRTYWRNKWMDNESYRQYKNDQPKRWKWLPGWFPWNSQTPKLAVDYIMDFKINGKSYPRW